MGGIRYRVGGREGLMMGGGWFDKGGLGLEIRINMGEEGVGGLGFMVVEVKGIWL